METNAQYFDCLCRTCMNNVEASSYGVTTKPQQQWLSIFDIIEECGGLRIAELLSDAVPQIVVQPSDELPKKICSECLQRLLNVYWFQQMCVQSDKQMHELLSKEQIVLKTPILEEEIKDETKTNDADSQPLADWVCSSTLQNLQQPTIQESLSEVTVPTVEPEAAQSSAADHLQDNFQLLELCNDSQGEFGEFIKNEPIEDDNPNSEYSDGDTMHSTISVIKYELIEPEDQQVNDASSRHNCHLCNKYYKNRKHLIRHLNDHKKKANNSKEYCFACHLCSESYKEQRYLSRHLKRAHSMEPQRYCCDVCNKSFASSSGFHQHIRTHTGGPECGISFTAQSEDKPYECPYCPLRFNSKKCMASHKTSHEEGKLHECDICGKEFKTRPNLKYHKRIHSKEKPHKCDICEKRFSLMQTLKNHIRTHTGEKPYKCKYCEHEFASLCLLSRHLHSHLGKNIHRCKFCPLAFSLAAEMRLHLTSHKNEDPEVRERNLKALQEEEAKLVLKFSKEKSKGESIEEQQQQKLSNKEIEQPSTDILEEQCTTYVNDKPYECPYCPLRFSSKTSASIHKKIHEGIKPHNCSICGKQFLQKSDFMRHKQIHTKEKPHKCDLCEKQFAQMPALKAHIRTHTGEKPYKCIYCERGFAAPNLLNVHLRTHLGKNIHRCQFCPLAFPSSAERRLHSFSHKNEDPETRERNLKDLQEEEAKLKLIFSKERAERQACMRNLKALQEKEVKLELKFSKERTERQSKEEQQQQKFSNKEIEKQSTELEEFEEFIKNEPIEDDKSNKEYSDKETISITKDEALPIEFEDQQVN